MKYTIERTSQFKKDFKLAEKQGLDMDQLKIVIKMLADGEELPEKYRDHPLKGDYKGHRECHIEDGKEYKMRVINVCETKRKF